MKAKLHIVGLLIVLCLTLTAVTVAADTVLFGNYPIDGTTAGYKISNGGEVTDSLVSNVIDLRGLTVTELKFGVWLHPGDTVTSVTWSLDSLRFGIDNGSLLNTNYGRGAGCAECGTLAITYLFTNKEGYQVAEVTVSGLNGGKGVILPGPNAWLTLKDATAYGPRRKPLILCSGM
jgi:hypothetical protein